MSKSNIEWTEVTWNVLRGCSRVSEGCRNCYAEWTANRMSGPGGAYEGLVEKRNGRPGWTGKIKLVEEKLAEPLGWKKPRTVFVNSMSDLFQERVPDEFIRKVFAVMADCPQHNFQVLTKRPERMREWVDNHGPKWSSEVTSSAKPLHNVWLGVSAEDQQTLDERAGVLRGMPNAVPWVSLEPLLGPVDVRPYLDFLKWVVLGGESGPGARPMHPEWARSVRDQCQAAGVPFFFKQHGNYRVWQEIAAGFSNRTPQRPSWKGGFRGEMVEPKRPEWAGTFRIVDTSGSGFVEVRKRRAGRELDGREHNDMPEVG